MEVTPIRSMSKTLKCLPDIPRSKAIWKEEVRIPAIRYLEKTSSGCVSIVSNSQIQRSIVEKEKAIARSPSLLSLFRKH